MKKLLASGLAAVALGGAAVLAAAPANAAPDDDGFSACIHSNGYYPQGGVATEWFIGRGVAEDLANGVAPIAERNWIVRNRPVTNIEANVIVNCSAWNYLDVDLTV